MAIPYIDLFLRQFMVHRNICTSRQPGATKIVLKFSLRVTDLAWLFTMSQSQFCPRNRLQFVCNSKTSSWFGSSIFIFHVVLDELLQRYKSLCPSINAENQTLKFFVGEMHSLWVLKTFALLGTMQEKKFKVVSRKRNFKKNMKIIRWPWKKKH